MRSGSKATDFAMLNEVSWMLPLRSAQG